MFRRAVRLSSLIGRSAARHTRPLSTMTPLPWSSAVTMPIRPLSTKPAPSSEQARLASLVAADTVVVFMKGTPAEPMCGFSKLVCKVMDMHAVPFKSYNVLEDDAMREGVKEFSEWPTIPQVYVGAVFVGGADIMVEMHQNGELVKILKENGVTSKLADAA